MDARKTVEQLLSPSGLVINGPKSWDPQVHDPRFFGRVLRDGSLGLGESYMEGWWDCGWLDEMFARLLRHDPRPRMSVPLPTLMSVLASRMLNLQSARRAFRIGEAHYDLGNDLYRAMLDPRMVYTCGYWEKGDTLAQAQERKLDLVCRKVGLQRGMRVLDVGCGWGSFAKFAAERYGAHAHGITVSSEQFVDAKWACSDMDVDFSLCDYRMSPEGPYDRIVSLGMVEHVGYKNLRTFMREMHRRLVPSGLFLLHTIGADRSMTSAEPWIGKYIFPNSMLPSLAQLSRAAEGLFKIEDVHNIGAHYDPTLMAWCENLERAWPELQSRYDKRFRRMWRYYLLTCAGTFRARHAQVYQIVLSKGGVPDGYVSVR